LSGQTFFSEFRVQRRTLSRMVGMNGHIRPGGRAVARWNPEVNDIFLAALDIDRPPERLRYLDQICHGNTELRGHVEQLLAASASAGDFLQTPPTEVSDAVEAIAVAEPVSTGPGSFIGPYRLLGRIGEGGFGSVYLAEQKEPVRRSVALKIIKLGMDTRQVIARFEAERQALAMMDHPNIARVLDAGATETGRPYFVMELVKGVPITQYCDDHRVSLNERLALFTDVCCAVQHAHQKGIIHRDLKPSNVLVSRHDDRPVVKVIDFGIAKATGVRLTDKTLHTEWRQLVGTPTYMSPEQAGMSDLDVDTRSDIYALGVLLYELLTGTTPFDKQALLSSGFDEMRRVIREVEPPKPSTRVSSFAARFPSGSRRPVPGESSAAEAFPQEKLSADSSSAITIANARRTDPRLLSRQLRGDLDWIVMKCLEKDRARRYETANGLAADVQRYLTGEPVVAAPPSRLYRFWKFARRNRGTVIAATVVTAALLAGMTGTTYGLLKAREQRELAEMREKQTQEVADFQAAMMRSIDVEKMGRGIKERLREQVKAALERKHVGEYPDLRKPTREEVETGLGAFDELTKAIQAADVARGVMDEFVLARAARALEKQFGDQPLVRAQLHDAIGRVYRPLGLYDAAEPHLRAALEIRQRELGEEHELVAHSLRELGVLRLDQGDYAAAELLFRQSLALYRRLHGQECYPVAVGLGWLAQALNAKDDGEAEVLHRAALAMYRKLRGDEHPDVAAAMVSLAVSLVRRKDHAAAEELYTQALALYRRTCGEEHPGVAVCLNNLAYLLSERGDHDGAEQLYREAIALDQKRLGDGHPDVATGMNNLAELLQAKGDFPGAESLLREALASGRKLHGDGHPVVVIGTNNLAELLRAKGDFPGAESLHREALKIGRTLWGSEHPLIGTSLHNLGGLLLENGDPAAAVPLLGEALAMRRKLLGIEHPEVALTLQILAQALERQGDLSSVEALYRELLAMLQRLSEGDNLRVAVSLDIAANALRRLHHPAEALPAYGAALAMRQRLYQGDHPDVAKNLSDLAYVLMRELDQPGEALPKYEAALAMRQRLYHGDHWDVAWTLNEMAHCLYLLGRPAEALPNQKAAQAMWKRLVPEGDANIANSLGALSLLLLKQGKYDNAEPLLRECLSIREKVIGPDAPNSWYFVNTRSMLGGALAGQGAALIESDVPAAIARFSEAEPMLVESAGWLTQNADHIPEQHRAERLRQALERVVKLYECWDTVAPNTGKAEQSATWRAELKQLSGP